MSTWDDARAAPDAVTSVGDGRDVEERLVRPFVITGGRTRHARVHLRVEALVVATGAATSVALQFEHERIIHMCDTPISVSEVAARIGIPLGVAQILVADLAEAGLLQIHEARHAATPALLLRMIDAVRAL
ncbi:MAG: DUF742 domain-containing protein [Actinobacteria bacterium]|nr:DUF742 domain-containing protein [Actinomycetota bacterium]